MVIVTTWDWPAVRLRLGGLADIVKGAVTVTAAAADVDAPSEVSPSYVAVTLLEPVGSAEVVNVAVPVCDGGYGVFRVAVPRTVVELPLREEKLTAPTPVEGVTAVVKVTGVPE